MSRAWCCTLPGAVRLALQVTPTARNTVVVGILGDVLKLKLAARPIEGQANAALVKFLAGALSVPSSAVTITHGLSSKHKLVEVMSATLTPGDVTRLLAP